MCRCGAAVAVATTTTTTGAAVRTGTHCTRDRRRDRRARRTTTTTMKASTDGGAREDTSGRRRARVAVIGAGAAGLAAIRACEVEGHTVVAFELANDVGGTWRYESEVEDDEGEGASAAPDDGRRAKVHGSMYASLRTNLPRELMGFGEFPFHESHGVDERRFCGHEEVQRYLQAYAETFGLRERVTFNAKVTSVERVFREDAEAERAWSSQWAVASSIDGGTARREVFDAVIVANGHYSEPRVPRFKGARTWPGQQVHSHNYRTPDGFEGKTVLLIGAMASGEDISREIASVADRVLLSARTWQNPEWATSVEGVGTQGNIYRKPNVASFSPDGSVDFEDGSVEHRVDICMYCTGYRYDFPFLSRDVGVAVEDNFVAPLYEHCVAVDAPSLSFIGLPWKVVPFPMFEIQSRWIARMLSGAVPMPSREDMVTFAAQLESTLEPHGGVPRRHAHCFGDKQWEYNARIASMSDGPGLESWREQMYIATGKNKRANPETYRDAHMSDAEALAAALDEFTKVATR